jgi:PAS domain S-box-containing protein
VSRSRSDPRPDEGAQAPGPRRARLARKPQAVDSIADSAGNASVILQRLIERAPHAMAVTEGACHVLQSVNRAFCRLMDVAEEDVLGRPFAEAFPGQRGGVPMALLDQVFGSGKAEEGREVTRGKALSAEVWSYTVWPLDRGSGAPAGLVLEVRDQTERSQVQQRLEDMAELIRQINERLLRSALQEQEWADKAEAANQAKSDFLSVMSHELRTPLTGIMAYTDILDGEVMGPLTDRQRESLARIKACSVHLLELIDDVLSFAKVEAHNAEVHLERVDLCSLVQEAAAVIEPVAARKGLELRISTPDAPLTAETDPQKVKQILLNLLSNAVKFTDQGEVSLEASADNGAIHLSVSDTGRGISGPDLERIFEPFVQTESVTTRQFGGTGLGLAISRALARMLGGDVSVQSTPGKGSVFSVVLLQQPPASSALQ